MAGATTVRFSVGDRAPELQHELSRADVIRYAGASGDFFPLHTDDDYARTVGLHGICAHGMLTAGLLSTAITGWLGVGCLRRYRVRFAAKAWPGEALTTRITVTAVRGREVEFACEVANAQGEVKITGSGTAVPTSTAVPTDSTAVPSAGTAVPSAGTAVPSAGTEGERA